MKQSRLKSAVAWTALAGVIALVAKSWFGFEIPDWDAIVTGVVGVLVAFGVFNNPTSSNTF